MLLGHAFAMTCDPFDRDIDCNELFESAGLREFHARLRYLLELGGMGLFTGEVGSGKTTAVRRLCESLHPGTHKAAYVCPSSVSTTDLYRAIAIALDLQPVGNRVRALHQIRDEIERLVTARKLRPVLVIDEVQLLRNEVLDELRLLTNYRMDSKNLLTVVLVGQPEFRRKLTFSVHEAFAQRLVVRAHLDGIGRDEIGPYLAHQLRRASVHHPLFTDAAVGALADASRGALRLLNLLARQALLAAAAAKAAQADTEHVRRAVVDNT